MEICINCKKRGANGQFWILNNYHGISGRFCSDCYAKVLHDTAQPAEPMNPKEYLMILLKQEKKDGEKAQN